MVARVGTQQFFGLPPASIAPTAMPIPSATPRRSVRFSGVDRCPTPLSQRKQHERADSEGPEFPEDFQSSADTDDDMNLEVSPIVYPTDMVHGINTSDQESDRRSVSPSPHLGSDFDDHTGSPDQESDTRSSVSSAHPNSDIDGNTWIEDEIAWEAWHKDNLAGKFSELTPGRRQACSVSGHSCTPPKNEFSGVDISVELIQHLKFELPASQLQLRTG
jgi:hypothetical protein